MTLARHLLAAFGLIYLLPLALHAAWWMITDPAKAWNEVDWSSSGILAPARARPQALVHVYAARVGRWRGTAAEHTWIVVKEKGATSYTRFDKTFWGRPVKTNVWVPDSRWYGHTPYLVGRVEGADAERLIPQIRRAVARYPFSAPGGYRAWPGPNSNSFVAHVLRSVPASGVAMPPLAIGKDFRTDWWPIGRTPSGTGVEISLFGLVGAAAGWAEGIEVNILGLTAGVDVRRPAIKLPGFGRIGLSSA